MFEFDCGFGCGFSLVLLKTANFLLSSWHCPNGSSKFLFSPSPPLPPAPPLHLFMFEQHYFCLSFTTQIPTSFLFPNSSSFRVLQITVSCVHSQKILAHAWQITRWNLSWIYFRRSQYIYAGILSLLMILSFPLLSWDFLKSYTGLQNPVVPCRCCNLFLLWTNVWSWAEKLFNVDVHMLSVEDRPRPFVFWPIY